MPVAVRAAAAATAAVIALVRVMIMVDCPLSANGRLAAAS
jgi:hypothetical protein